MKNGIRQNVGPERGKSSIFRIAILMVLAGMTGALIDRLAHQSGEPTNPTPIVGSPVTGADNDTGDNDDNGDTGGGDGDGKKPRPLHFVPGDIFDENPDLWVKVDECRALLFSVTGDPNCQPPLGEEEVLKRAHEKEVKSRQEIAEAMIDQLCIVNPEDAEAIRKAVQDGFTEMGELHSFGDSEDLTHALTLESVSPSAEKHIDLNENPG
ncbi:MAG: hypothetical protein V1760_03020, partial [Candidatus Peregrinibacteria bacterium]